MKLFRLNFVINVNYVMPTLPSFNINALWNRPQLDELSIKPRPSIDLTNNAQSPSHKVQRSTSNQKPRRTTDQSKTRLSCKELLAAVLLRSMLFFLYIFIPVSFSDPAPGLSVKRTQGDSKHIAEDYGRKSSGSSAKVPPSPLTTADRKKTPTPSTVSPRFPHVNSRVSGDSITVFGADCSFLCRTEQHPFNWYESWEKLSRSWEIHSGCTERQGQVQTHIREDMHTHARYTNLYAGVIPLRGTRVMLW